jgi:adenosine 3'-phospho 5'-phosphosulfate transporter B2
MLSLVGYGVIQERIMTVPYGTDTLGKPVRFTDSTFLVLMNRLVAAAMAVSILLWQRRSLMYVAPLYKYFGISVSNISATWCQYEALKYVNFPTQTLGKTGKMIPVMVLGTLLSNKRYTGKDYVLNILITLGCTAFILTGDVSNSGRSNTPLGVGLMVGFLFIDGFTSTFQEKLFKGYTMSTYNQMLYVNLCSTVLSLATLLVTGGLFRSFDFAIAHPAILRDALMLSFCAAFGQVCIYATIKEFGALTFAGIMVTRQVVSVIVSCIVYFHSLSVGQIISAATVFGTLYYLEGTKTRHPPPPKLPFTAPPHPTTPAGTLASVPDHTGMPPTQVAVK